MLGFAFGKALAFLHFVRTHGQDAHATGFQPVEASLRDAKPAPQSELSVLPWLGLDNSAL
jgi:hypothetical protein